jgi:hypothetical protein
MNGKNKNSKLNTNGKSRKLGRSGQVLIESLLLMVLSVSFLGIAVKYFKETQTFSKITNVVWAGVAQVAEYGNWPSASPPIHPNSSIRTRLWDPQQ